MALSAYQLQFKRRMKRAIRQRARSDQKSRRYTQLLADALRLSQDAAAQLNTLNQLYNVDVSTQTLLVHDLLDVLQPEQLAGVLGQSTPGEEVQLFNLIPDGNGGQELPANPLFGEEVMGPPIIPPVQTAKELALKESTVLNDLLAAETDMVGPIEPTASNRLST
ncbi:hypothetical protein [Hymenobacter psychrophilus]|uniref:Uncharacterized protein n=1 Tax=Hymenobacter psychrophilus TaxID=651662 RepID=A0A1H3IRI9_9BACT|nr:hypothetical protein [Hymenobacter psychrophilus]SDY30433.1 hypothetical protein SAMN04488069_107131 [Hymenobacter psychrophilus]